MIVMRKEMINFSKFFFKTKTNNSKTRFFFSNSIFFLSLSFFLSFFLFFSLYDSVEKGDDEFVEVLSLGKLEKKDKNKTFETIS